MTRLTRARPWLIGRETGDLMNIAVSDIETLEFFFAHTIGPMFTVILLPLTTVILAFCVNPLYAWVLIPIYLMISVVLPFSALKAGRGIGMRYRERLGILKSKILESVYSIRDIQIFGAGERKAEEIQRANDEVNHASFWLTLHRQTVASFPNFFVYLARILILVCAGVLASRGINNPVGTIALSFAATASLSSTFNLTFVVTSLLETYGAAERIFQIEDTLPETTEPESPVSCGEIQTIEFRDVSFSYPGTEKKILDHMNLIIKKGDQIGIEGESGAGKSTILRLLLRFYAPSEGRFYSMESQARKLVLPSFISESHFLSRIPICLMIPSRRTLQSQSRRQRQRRFGLRQSGLESTILLRHFRMGMIPIWVR